MILNGCTVGGAPAPPTATAVPVAAALGTQTAAGLEIGLAVQPAPAGDRFSARLRLTDGRPLRPEALDVQLDVIPQDNNAGATRLPLALPVGDGGALTYLATAPILGAPGSYLARVQVGGGPAGAARVAFRLDLAAGKLAIRPAPFVGLDVESRPNPAVAGQVELDLRLTDSVGAPLHAAQVQVIPLMPSHSHVELQGTAAPVAGAPGLYRTTAHLSMAGDWLLLVDVGGPDARPLRLAATLTAREPALSPAPPP